MLPIDRGTCIAFLVIKAFWLSFTHPPCFDCENLKRCVPSCSVCDPYINVFVNFYGTVGEPVIRGLLIKYANKTCSRNRGTVLEQTETIFAENDNASKDWSLRAQFATFVCASLIFFMVQLDSPESGLQS